MPTYSKDVAGSLREMFSSIAGRYDILNRVMTFGQDIGWRRESVSKLGVKKGQLVGDLGCGTGDLAFEILRQEAGALVIACDFTPAMIRLGKEKRGSEKIQWLLADAGQLPFSSDIFDALISGFLLRNVNNLDNVLGEQWRILKKGSRVVSLDSTPVRSNLLSPLVKFHLNIVIPFLGQVLTGNPEAYQYFPRSTSSFLSAEKLGARLEKAGFSGIQFVRRTFGSVAIHWGKK